MHPGPTTRSLAEYMESRARPPGALQGPLALPVAQAGMLLAELWKRRGLHRGCTAKPVTTAMLKGARPHYTIRPRANNTASGDMLVVLNVRRRPPPAGGGVRSPDLPQLPGITFTSKPAQLADSGTGPAAPETSTAQQRGSSDGMAGAREALEAAAAAAAAVSGASAEMQDRVTAALAQLLGAAGAERRGAGSASDAIVDWRLLEAGLDDIWPPR